MLKILLTGATGFIGKALLKKIDHHTVAVLGRNKPEVEGSFESFSGQIEGNTDYGDALQGRDVVVHCAGLSHVLQSSLFEQAESETPCWEVNVRGTLNLAQQAAFKGVSRFIFVSTVKVNGESTEKSGRFHSGSPYSPQDLYAASKAEAERALLALASKTNMEIIIIRPPLVYGPGVKGNFQTLLSLVYKRCPLPLGSINNKRSLISITNLIDFIIVCIEHPQAGNEIFMVSDGDDKSTTELLCMISKAFNNKIVLLPVSPVFLRVVACMLGKRGAVRSLCGSLQVDSSRAAKLLDWSPSVSLETELQNTVDFYLEQTKKEKYL